MRTEEIERELREMRPEPDPDFARRLDEWAAADFPADAGLGPQRRRAGAGRAARFGVHGSGSARHAAAPDPDAGRRHRDRGDRRRGGDQPDRRRPTRSRPPSGAGTTAAGREKAFDTGCARELSRGRRVEAAATSRFPTPPQPPPPVAGDSGDGVAGRHRRRGSSTRPRGSRSPPRATRSRTSPTRSSTSPTPTTGIVLDSQVTTDQGGARANFSLDIPYKQLDSALSELSGLADVVSRTEGGEDITAKAVRAQRELAGTLERLRKARIALIDGRHPPGEAGPPVADRLARTRAPTPTGPSWRASSARRASRPSTSRSPRRTPTAGSGGGWSLDDAFHDAGPRPRGDRRHRPGHPRGDAADVADRAPRLGDRLTDGEAPPRSRPQLRNPAGCSASRPLPPGLGGTGAALLVMLEVGLAGAADRAEPGVGDLGEVGPGRDAAVGVALVRVVDESAGAADPQLLRLGLGAHGSAGYRPPS